jgi:hypothetical protein
MYCADIKIPLEGLTAACCSIASGRLVVCLSRNRLPHVATSQCPGCSLLLIQTLRVYLFYTALLYRRSGARIEWKLPQTLELSCLTKGLVKTCMCAWTSMNIQERVLTGIVWSFVDNLCIKINLLFIFDLPSLYTHRQVHSWQWREILRLY